ncbi:hypothetical protein [Paenibacillus qinlingensis]|uniref:Uncharacterized protein n=1 Tax=Paenibacillus qinlingensis TaxID=1837343 RepID=A0ABU1NSV1_9BACL|nr:hypothetical protein [Paenibacillus qinlingensis]MDR6550560.1 hypothetical protein [Paenibacillus qinlingensis]
MKLHFPLFFAAICLLSILADKFLISWVSNLYLKAIIFALSVGLANYLIGKSGLSAKRIATPLGILIFALGLTTVIVSNHI